MDAAMTELTQKTGACFSESMASVFSMLTGRDFTIAAQAGSSVDHAAAATLWHQSITDQSLKDEVTDILAELRAGGTDGITPP